MSRHEHIFAQVSSPAGTASSADCQPAADSKLNPTSLCTSGWSAASYLIGIQFLTYSELSGEENNEALLIHKMIYSQVHITINILLKFAMIDKFRLTFTLSD